MGLKDYAGEGILGGGCGGDGGRWNPESRRTATTDVTKLALGATTATATTRPARMPAARYQNIRSTTNTQCPFLAREGPSDRTREPKWGMVPFDYESRLEWLRFIVVERAYRYRCPRCRPPPA